MRPFLVRAAALAWLAVVLSSAPAASQETDAPAQEAPAAAAGADAAPQDIATPAQEAGAPAPGGEAPAQGPDPAGARETVSFDVVRLYGVEGKTLVEIYSRIPTHVLTFIEADGRWEAGLAFELTVRRGDEVVLEDSWTRTKTVADRRMLDSSRLSFVETHAFLIAPGTYELEGAITDASGKELGALRRTLEAPAENPPVSDLLLVARISPDTSEQAAEGYDPVRKHQLVLNPNPGQVYSTAVSPLVYFYVEFENVQPEPLTLERVLRFRPKGSDGVVKEARATKTYQPGWTIDFGAVNLTGLKAGTYELEASWEGAGGAEVEPYRGLTRKQDFTFLREARAQPAPQAASGAGADAGGQATPAAPAGPVVDYYESYSEAELDSIFRILDVLFERSEKSVYEGLTADGKRTFLNHFWARRDPTPGTPTNEYREEVDARLDAVQNSFRGPQQQGYETPRGRIYLKYGKPDRRVERVLETGFSAPYEIWIYYGTGYKYVFLDEFRNRRYILLTSTDPEEQGRPDWMERLPSDAIQEILRE